MKNSFIMLLACLFLIGCSDDSEPSCGKVSNVNFTITSTSILIYFDSADISANSFEIEYGPAGFTQGNGNTVITSNDNYIFQNLEVATSYDFYITSICSSSEQGETTKLLNVTTNPSSCTGTVQAEFNQYALDAINLQLDYSGDFMDNWIIEYGEAGFTLGTGTIETFDGSYNNVTINGISADTTYDFYIKAQCNSNESDYSENTYVQYTSLPYCPEPYHLRVDHYAGNCTNLIQYICFWDYYTHSNVVSYTLSITSDMNDPNEGTWLETSEESAIIQGYICGRYLYVRANCTDGNSSDWIGPYIL